ncbi:MAG: hypothetical protein JXB88_19460 [Spirochaetales bacterium]|nr:hypothetical protein [Spirochaetales bacterium]
MNRLILSFPFFWVCLSAFFLGAGFCRITYFIKRNKEREKHENRKWVMVCIFFSISIIFAMCALLFSVSKEIVHMKNLYLYLLIVVISFLGLRFKKAFGIPVLFLFIFCFLIMLLFFQSLTAFSGDTMIAEIHMLSVKEKFMTFELVFPDNSYRVLSMKGTYFAPVVKVIIFDDLLVFFGIKTWYRFAGITAFERDKEKEILSLTDTFKLHEKPGISKNLYNFFEEYEEYIPGVKSVQIEVTQKKAKEFTRYSISVQNDGGIIITIIK